MNIQKRVTTKYYDKEDDNQEYMFEPVEDTVLLKTIPDGTYELRYLTPEESPMSPDEWDHEGLFLVHYHRDFWIEHKEITRDILAAVYQGDEPEIVKDYYVFPVSALIHSGVWLSLAKDFAFDSGGWDTSHVGAIFVKKTEFGAGGVQFEHTQEDAKSMAEDLLEEWNQYLTGDVYCLVCEKLDNDKKQTDYDIIGGFYGLDYAKECLKTEI